MAGLVEGYRESYQCIPAKILNFCVFSGEQHLLTAALTNYQLICKYTIGLIMNKSIDS